MLSLFAEHIIRVNERSVYSRSTWSAGSQPLPDREREALRHSTRRIIVLGLGLFMRISLVTAFHPAHFLSHFKNISSPS